MCGEHADNSSMTFNSEGSSPHVRGARQDHQTTLQPRGIIPACAGSTSMPCVPPPVRRDHPRMCGEHGKPERRGSAQVGSSPHVRGALYADRRIVRCVGIIPACAGSTQQTCSFLRLKRDHPRMCGEHRRYFARQSPRLGSSPHVRGAPDQRADEQADRGIIPACAGSTTLGRRSRTSYWDHPRMCGEHISRNMTSLLTWGSSPHVRGAQHVFEVLGSTFGIIPACAGSTLPLNFVYTGIRDHPRMCGEHAYQDMSSGGVEGSSPHVRGALTATFRPVDDLGIIPACAGSTLGNSMAVPVMRDHPRMCGEHPFQPMGSFRIPGSSPHVRGARNTNGHYAPCAGIIPACAGSTSTRPIGRVSDRDHPRMCGEHTLPSE